jgi:hypothetical protein
MRNFKLTYRWSNGESFDYVFTLTQTAVDAEVAAKNGRAELARMIVPEKASKFVLESVA